MTALRREFPDSRRPPPGTKRISIAMCTYNGEVFLRDQLDSFLGQTRLPDELVVCDDQSGDRTVEIIKEFAKSAPFTVRLYVNDINLGPTKNFERAIDLTTGDIVVLASWDDVWMPQKLERTEAALTNSEHIGLVLTDAELVDRDLKPLHKTLWEVRRFSLVDRLLVSRGRTERLLRKNIGATYGTTMAFKSTYKSAILPIPAGVLEDAWIALVVVGMAEVALIPEPLVRYRQHGANISGSARAGFLTQLNVARSNRPETFLARAERLRLAARRLQSVPTRSDRFCRHLHKGEKHMLFRASLPESHLARSPLILWQFLMGGYRRYSDGWRSAAGDLFLR